MNKQNSLIGYSIIAFWCLFAGCILAPLSKLSLWVLYWTIGFVVAAICNKIEKNHKTLCGILAFSYFIGVGIFLGLYSDRLIN
jgi:hypothetical protein